MTGQPGGQPLGTPSVPGQPGGQPSPAGIQVTAVDSSYATASRGLSGWFTSGQAADIMLSGIDFNDTGGALLFNHPGTVTSDGEHLLLADRNNNRVLIWLTLPSTNTPPDLVLGQPDFTANNPGAGADQMNWPVSVSAAGGKVAVADTYNDRILIWNSFPARNGQYADLILKNPAQPNSNLPPIRWPWGVWTDGTKLALSSTQGGNVQLWHTFPTTSGQPPDVTLTAQGKMGTPRTITSDGQYLIVADHNAKIGETAPGSPMGGPATFVWKTWPTVNDQPYDFTLDGWRQGTFADGRLILVSTTHFPPSVWNEPPQSADDEPDLALGQGGGFQFQTGDGSGITWAGGHLYLSLSNGNRIVGYNTFPASSSQLPDFVIGAPDIYTNTLETNFIVSNPVVATDGKSLFVSSDFDRKLYVWKSLPGESGAHPDWVYSLPEPPWDNALWGSSLALAGQKTVYIWTSLPLNGEQPDLTFTSKIGSVTFQDIIGVALDDKYFYLADGDKIYVWEGIPAADSEPKFRLTTQGAGRLDSNGEYLVTIVNFGHDVAVYRVADLSANSQPSILPTSHDPAHSFNLPGSAMVYAGHLFIADTGFDRVLIWNDIAGALAGKTADVILGAGDFQDTSPEIGADKLFWPCTLAFDGSYLWVGEFKFSERILRFSVR